MENEKLERIIKTKPPFDKRHPNQSKNYGVGSLTLWFILKGSKGAVQFAFMTGAYPNHVQQEFHEKGLKPTGFMGMDVGYHSPKPMCEGQTKMDCDLLPKGKCYYDGSALRATEVLQIYMEGGDEAIWKFLETEYKERFCMDK